MKVSYLKIAGQESSRASPLHFSSPLFFFSGFCWLQMSLQRVGEALYRGWGACRLSSWRQAPCRPSSWRQAPRPPNFRIFTLVFLHLVLCRQVLGRQAPCRPSSWRPDGIFVIFSNRVVFLQFKI